MRTGSYPFKDIAEDYAIPYWVVLIWSDMIQQVDSMSDAELTQHMLGLEDAPAWEIQAQQVSGKWANGDLKKVIDLHNVIGETVRREPKGKYVYGSHQRLDQDQVAACHRDQE